MKGNKLFEMLVEHLRHVEIKVWRGLTYWLQGCIGLAVCLWTGNTIIYRRRVASKDSLFILKCVS